MAAVRAANAEDAAAAAKGAAKNGTGAATKEGEEREGRELGIPQGVLREGIRNVRREIERVCELRVDDVDD